jgi:hypothetical protein
VLISTTVFKSATYKCSPFTAKPFGAFKPVTHFADRIVPFSSIFEM